MKITRKSLALFTTGVALLLTVLSYLIKDYPAASLQLRPIVDLLDLVEAPGAFAGIAVSGNPHQPNALAFYFVLFVTYWLISGVVVWFAHVTLRHRRLVSGE